jgi:uncharacterized protein YjbJ (UPF0337 family)
MPLRSPRRSQSFSPETRSAVRLQRVPWANAKRSRSEFGAILEQLDRWITKTHLSRVWVKGKVKETAGNVTNNPGLQAEGTAEKTPEKSRNKVGQIEQVLEKQSGWALHQSTSMRSGQRVYPPFPAPVIARKRRTSA